MEPVVLSGLWQLRPVDAFAEAYPPLDGWHEQELPAQWQQLPALETHTGKVVYRKAFTAPADARRRWLKLHGVFYRYRVRLNGVLVGETEGYFFPHEFEVTEQLRPGQENELLIEVDSPIERSRLQKETITGVFAHWDALSSYKYNPGGLWLPVELVHHPAVHIERALIHLESFDDQAAYVGLRLDLKVEAAVHARYRVTFTPRNFEGEARSFEGEIDLAAGKYGWQQALTLAPYKLWWTHDTGHPHLYDVAVELSGPIDHPVVWRGTTGLRTWSMRDWIGYLNGQRLYMKGSNYPPGDARLGTMTLPRAAQDMQLATDAHMNMLRIHAHVDHPAVYQAADEAGVLLWQDFPMQWLYAKKVLPQALRQSLEMVKLLHNHPSIVLWCLHNEPLHVDDTSEEPLLRMLRTYWSLITSWNRDVMDRQMAAGVEHLDKSRTVVHSSGEMWIPGWLTGTDGHYYFGWYMSYGPKRWFDLWRRVFTRNLRFVTEFGSQSFPNHENAKTFLPENLEGADFKHLLRHYLLQWDLMKLWIDTSSHDLKDLVQKTQAYQSEINRYYVDRLRFYKYKPNGGFLNFMFMDSQPAVSWSIVDYWRTPKSSYWAYKHALSPQYAFCLTPKDQYARGRAVALPVYVVNDAHRPVPVKVTIGLDAPDGREVSRKEHVVTLGADCLAQSLGDVAFRPETAGVWRLRLVLEQEGVAALENLYELPVSSR